MMKSAWQEFREGVADIVPVAAAAVPIGLLWGTLANASGLTLLRNDDTTTTLAADLAIASAVADSGTRRVYGLSRSAASRCGRRRGRSR